jgi:hypothetical protein
MFRRFIAALIISNMVATAFASDRIIRSRGKDADQGRFRMLGGNWVNSPRESMVLGEGGVKAAKGKTGGLGSRKIIFSGPNATTATASITTGIATARFLPNLKTAENLYIYGTWPRGANAKNIHVAVKHATGEDNQIINQTGYGKENANNGDRWHFLGHFDFATGPQQWVEFRSSSKNGGVFPRRPVEMYVDAVRFLDRPLEPNELRPPALPSKTSGYFSSPDSDTGSPADADVDPAESTALDPITTPGTKPTAATSKPNPANVPKTKSSPVPSAPPQSVPLESFGMPALEGHPLPAPMGGNGR